MYFFFHLKSTDTHKARNQIYSLSMVLKFHDLGVVRVKCLQRLLREGAIIENKVEKKSIMKFCGQNRSSGLHVTVKV